jgi:hypothetical protein
MIPVVHLENNFSGSRKVPLKNRKRSAFCGQIYDFSVMYLGFFQLQLCSHPSPKGIFKYAPLQSKERLYLLFAKCATGIK